MIWYVLLPHASCLSHTQWGQRHVTLTMTAWWWLSAIVRSTALVGRHAKVRRRWQRQTNGATSGRKDVRIGCGAISDVRTRGRYCGLNRRRTLARQCSHAPLRCSVRRRPAARTTVLAAAARPRSGLPASAAKAARPPARSAGRQPCRPFNEWLNRWATHLHRRRLRVATALCIECDRVCVRACVRACR